jgi:hypothetical protein
VDSRHASVKNNEAAISHHALCDRMPRPAYGGLICPRIFRDLMNREITVLFLDTTFSIGP